MFGESFKESLFYLRKIALLTHEYLQKYRKLLPNSVHIIHVHYVI